MEKRSFLAMNEIIEMVIVMLWVMAIAMVEWLWPLLWPFWSLTLWLGTLMVASSVFLVSVYSNRIGLQMNW
jgi:hypothetical protein